MRRGVHAHARRGATIVAALLAAALASATVQAAPARADFTESFCSGGLPSAPWVQGPLAGTNPWLEANDRCAVGGVIGWDTHQDPLPGGKWSTGVDAPPGEVFTHVTFNYTTEGSSTGALFALFGRDASSILAESKVSATGLAGTVDAVLPESTQVWTRVDCDASSCPLTLFSNVVAIGAMNLTIHDTGVPAIASTGGSLAAGGRVKGTETLLFHATDVGSGVLKVTVSLGPAVLATVPSACQAASLAPCPGNTSGTLTANTALVPDGTYPVILTAYDVSGDATPIQVSTVTVANHTGSVSVPTVHKSKHHGRRHLRPLRVRAKFKWDWRGKTTRLDSAHFGRLPKGGRIALRCRGKRCPFKQLTSKRRGVRHLQHKLVKRVFRPGEKLDVRISAPHRLAERGTIVIRAGALPIVRAPHKK